MKITQPIVPVWEKTMKLASIVRVYFSGSSSSLTSLGWMTAELFVKLSAKLYAENRPLEKTNGKENGHLCRTETMDKQRARTYSTSSDSESSEGAEIHYSRDGELLIEFSPVNEARSSDLHRPAEWHSRELQRLNINENDKEKFSTLDEQLSTRSIPVQWLPANNNLFWKAYLNRLRVNAVSGGVIPLGWSYPSEAF
jgi:poly(A)-specific ribonuclease